MTTVSASYFKNFFDTCLAAGAQKEQLLPYISEKPKILDDLSSRICTETTLDMLKFAAQITKNNALGLDAGQNLRPTSFLDVGHAMLYCDSLRHVFDVNRRYQPITQQFGASSLVETADKAWLVWTSKYDDPEYSRIITDAVFASHIQFGRWLSWIYNRNIDCIHFKHKKPDYASDYEKLFECPVHFEQEYNAMILDRSLIDLALPQANAEMLASVCERLDIILSQINGDTPFPRQVQDLIMERLDGTPPPIADIAKIIDTSDRSLRRRLAEHQTSFRKLRAAARKELCVSLLASGDIPLAEIAVRLGYSEQSAFNRAFKNWYGYPPNAHKFKM